jgi:hypothetical protein
MLASIERAAAVKRRKQASTPCPIHQDSQSPTIGTGTKRTADDAFGTEFHDDSPPEKRIDRRSEENRR